jgi:hypothetical protein
MIGADDETVKGVEHGRGRQQVLVFESPRMNAGALLRSVVGGLTRH